MVGIARQSKYLTIGEERQGHIYLPFAQHPRSGVALLVRSALPPDRLGPAVQNALHSIDPNMQGFFTRTLTEHVGVSLLPVRLRQSWPRSLRDSRSHCQWSDSTR